MYEVQRKILNNQIINKLCADAMKNGYGSKGRMKILCVQISYIQQTW